MLIAYLPIRTRKALITQGNEATGYFLMSPLLRHIVPKLEINEALLSFKEGSTPYYVSDFDIAFATTHERRLQWCGQGVLFPNAYVAVGPLVYCQRPPYSKTRGHLEMVMDCGILLHMVQYGGSYELLNAPHVSRKDLRVGTWLACLGRLSFIQDSPDNLAPEKQLYRVRVVKRQILDLRTGSATFGQIIDWEIGRPAPHDPDEVPFHTDFYTLEMLARCL